MTKLRLALAGSAACAFGVWAGLSLSQVVPQPGPPIPIAGAYNTSPVTLTNGQAGWVQVDNAGNLKVNVASGGGTGGTSSTFGVAFPATGTAIGFTDGTNMVAGKVDGSGNIDINCAVGCGGGTFNNNADTVATSATNGQAASWPYVWNGSTWDRLYGDKTNGAFVNVKTSVLPTGGATAANQTTANTSLATIATNSGSPVPLGSTTGGMLIKDLPALTNTAVAIKASAGQLMQLYCWNPNSSVAYIQIYDVAAGSVTVGTTAHKVQYGIPPTASAGRAIGLVGDQFGTAISAAATTTQGGGTAPGTAVDCNVSYN